MFIRDKSQYIPLQPNKYLSIYFPISNTELDEYCRRLETHYDLNNNLPKTWDDFKVMHPKAQYRTAEIFSILVKVFESERTTLIDKVLNEYEWYIMDFWYYTCNSCRLPREFCRNYKKCIS